MFEALAAVGNDPYTVVRVAESVPTDRSGYATIIQNSQVYIETVLGGFHGLWKGGVAPTKYVADADGQVVTEEVNSTDVCYRLDPVVGEWRSVRLDRPVECRLTDQEIQQIIGMVRLLEQNLGNVSIEWTSSDTYGVSYFDLSQEDKKKTVIGETGSVISVGQVTSKIRVLDDAHALDSLFASLHEVNVAKGVSYYEDLGNKLADGKLLHFVGDARPILVADFPNRTLAPFIPLVSGFIFERGAALCHLSIILREAGIPAIIVPDAKRKYKNNQCVQIIGAQARIVSNPDEKMP
jgi:phosphoenolpyruvate synthase/pyruvate phosphate dikinase